MTVTYWWMQLMHFKILQMLHALDPSVRSQTPKHSDLRSRTPTQSDFGFPTILPIAL
ncbi:hypothetical protein [Sodalinema gerasimenkoae]|uniref:hypothetical protein n=1 Tax=Sodalinema gerasimenkoae TaxID=2862348 RepID=UPI00135C353A|nr:hypothetical protein [Sodalinema gerasimenkoae]